MCWLPVHHYHVAAAHNIIISTVFSPWRANIYRRSILSIDYLPHPMPDTPIIPADTPSRTQNVMATPICWCSSQICLTQWLSKHETSHGRALEIEYCHYYSTRIHVAICLYCRSLFGTPVEDMDDDSLYIHATWCGSRLLYAMWVISSWYNRSKRKVFWGPKRSLFPWELHGWYLVSRPNCDLSKTKHLLVVEGEGVSSLSLLLGQPTRQRTSWSFWLRESFFAFRHWSTRANVKGVLRTDIHCTLAPNWRTVSS